MRGTPATLRAHRSTRSAFGVTPASGETSPSTIATGRLRVGDHDLAGRERPARPSISPARQSRRPGSPSRRSGSSAITGTPGLGHGDREGVVEQALAAAGRRASGGRARSAPPACGRCPDPRPPGARTRGRPRAPGPGACGSPCRPCSGRPARAGGASRPAGSGPGRTSTGREHQPDARAAPPPAPARPSRRSASSSISRLRARAAWRRSWSSVRLPSFVSTTFPPARRTRSSGQPPTP